MIGNVLVFSLYLIGLSLAIAIYIVLISSMNKNNEPTVISEESPVFAEVQIPINPFSCHGIKITYKEVDISLMTKEDIVLAVQLIQELKKQC